MIKPGVASSFRVVPLTVRLQEALPEVRRRGVAVPFTELRIVTERAYSWGL